MIRKSSVWDAPIYVVRHDNGEYTAVLMKCTHRGCELRAEGALLSCPCHGSEFSDDGRVMQSPATENLQRFTISTEQSSVIIHLS